jgi:pimeloyl-ACP methyl ester carboxylesterase
MPFKLPKPRWRRVLVFLLVLSSGYLLVCFGLAKMYVSPFRSKPPAIRYFARTTLSDGEPIWISPGLQSGKPKGTTLYVMSHGLAGNVGHYSEIGNELIAKGYDVILTEMCAHGDSPDKTSTFGEKESDIIVEATKWARAKYGKPPRVVLVGVSLGGSSSWLATEKAPQLFDAIVTEAAFARLADVSDNFFDRRMPCGHIVFWPVKYFASKLSGVNPSDVNPIEAAKKWKGKPALVIECGNDNLMKASYEQDLASASGAELWIIPNASHAAGCQLDQESYLAKLVSFAEKETALAQNNPREGSNRLKASAK